MAFETIYSLSFCATARIKKRNNPDQTNNTIEAGGRLVEYPKITDNVVGNVAPWIIIIPTQPASSLNFFVVVLSFFM